MRNYFETEIDCRKLELAFALLFKNKDPLARAARSKTPMINFLVFNRSCRTIKVKYSKVLKNRLFVNKERLDKQLLTPFTILFQKDSFSLDV